jgi:hypothetical protein
MEEPRAKTPVSEDASVMSPFFGAIQCRRSSVAHLEMSAIQLSGILAGNNRRHAQLGLS